MDINPNQFSSRRSVVHSNQGIVATSQPLAAEAGVEILRQGGNAFDAAVASAATLNVVEATSTGLGGDVFALYRTADGDVGGLRSCGGAPSNATIENVIEALENEDDLGQYYPESRGYAVDKIESGSKIEMPFLGPHTVTVPGTARGWETTVQQLGRKSLGEVLQPAIRYAIGGFPVSEVISHDWEDAAELFTDDHAKDTFLFDGDTPNHGQMVTLPRLGTTLEKIANHGADVFYEGEIAEEIEAEVQSKGGYLTVDDLAAFEPEFVEPISTTYKGVEVFELPPNNQGLIALEALNIVEETNAGDHDHDAVERTHLMVESMKLAFKDGHHFITDPNYERIPPLNSKLYARERAELIGPSANQNPGIGFRSKSAEDADTVLLTVADQDGNIVSYINSRFAGFGSGLVAGDTGIALQNRGASFSLNPDHPNSLEPGKRPFHTLIPAIIKFASDDWAAFGVMGGYMQPQGHLQVLSNLVDSGMSLQEALDAPRWRYRGSGELAMEEWHPNKTELVRRGHDVRILSSSMFGGGQIVRMKGDVLSGATEPRKDGIVTGY